MQAGFRPDSVIDEAQDEYEEEKESVLSELRGSIASKYGVDEEKLGH